MVIRHTTEPWPPQCSRLHACSRGPVATFWEGEIVDNKHATFLLSRWGCQRTGSARPLAKVRELCSPPARAEKAAWQVRVSQCLSAPC